MFLTFYFARCPCPADVIHDATCLPLLLSAVSSFSASLPLFSQILVDIDFMSYFERFARLKVLMREALILALAIG